MQQPISISALAFFALLASCGGAAVEHKVSPAPAAVVNAEAELAALRASIHAESDLSAKNFAAKSRVVWLANFYANSIARKPDPYVQAKLDKLGFELGLDDGNGWILIESAWSTMNSAGVSRDPVEVLSRYRDLGLRAGTEPFDSKLVDDARTAIEKHKENKRQLRTKLNDKL